MNSPFAVDVAPAFALFNAIITWSPCATTAGPAMFSVVNAASPAPRAADKMYPAPASIAEFVGNSTRASPTPPEAVVIFTWGPLARPATRIGREALPYGAVAR